MKLRLLALLTLGSTALFAGQSEIAKYDPNMAQKDIVITNGIKWIDGKLLPIEGRAFDDTDHYYDRLPANVSTNVNDGVRSMKHHTAGMQFRFVTDSKKLSFKWIPYNRDLDMDHMPSSGVSGIDVYRFDAARDEWLYVGTGRIWDAKKGGSLSLNWTPHTPCLVNLPLYNGVKSFTLGIEPNATISPLGKRRSGIDKPVVFYGTSITHGGCCSRPGLAFPSIVGRDLDVPIVNLGFSGSGKGELEMSEHLAAIDASCYVLDCVWNMSASLMQACYEQFVRNLRRLRPDVPIILAEGCDVYCATHARTEFFARNRFVRTLFDRLTQEEGWQKLFLLPSLGQHANDFEGTVDGVHPNDWGMMHLAKAFGAVIREALELKEKTPPTPVDAARAEKLARATLAKMSLEEKVSLCGACATMYLNALPRVGINREWAFSDSSHGLKPEHRRDLWGYVKCDDRSTCLPAMSALAATWNRNLARAHGDVMGDQMRARGKDQMLGPAVNIMRNPLSGRNWEYLSEDPFLAAELTRPLVEAVQKHGVAATIKHFCMNSQELARFTQISTVDTRTFEEIYLPAFEAAIRDAGALSVMMAYVRLNGVYCSENPFLLKEILRNRWNFNGAVITDWGGQHSCDNAVMNGGGIECNFGRGVTYLTDFYGIKGNDKFPLATAVREGRVPSATVDEMVYHTLYMMARTGFLSGEQPQGQRLVEPHRVVARQIGEEAIVLAKNAKGVLPLDKAHTKKLVVFGQIADLKVAHLGSSCETHPEYEISFLDGLKEYLGESCTIVNYPLGSEGCTEPLAINLQDLTTFDPNGKDAFIERAWERRQYRDGKEIRLDYVRNAKIWWGVVPSRAEDLASTAKRCVGDEFVWTSSVEIRETGDYDFMATQGDLSQIAICVNGEEIIPWQTGAVEKRIHLEKGTTVPIAFKLRLGAAENRATFGWIPPSSRPAPVETLEAECRTADAVLVFTGTTLGFGRAKESEGEDRPDMLSLDGHDRDIAKILAWKLPNTVIICRSGSPLEQPWYDDCDTYLYTSYLGQEAGRPFARILFGEANPSGRIPFTWPKHWQDTAIATLGSSTYNSTNCVYGEGLLVGYRWYEKQGIGVQFPFGAGLSYTTFVYGKPELQATTEGWTITIPVTNTGKREGAEVVQLYLARPEGAEDRPEKELKGFEKLFLKPGETKVAVFTLGERELRIFDPLTLRWLVPSSPRQVLIGSSSADIRATLSFP